MNISRMEDENTMCTPQQSSCAGALLASNCMGRSRSGMILICSWIFTLVNMVFLEPKSTNVMLKRCAAPCVICSWKFTAPPYSDPERHTRAAFSNTYWNVSQHMPAVLCDKTTHPLMCRSNPGTINAQPDAKCRVGAAIIQTIRVRSHEYK